MADFDLQTRKAISDRLREQRERRMQKLSAKERELAQEILFTAVRELPRLREESRFEPWLWGIAANVTKSFRRNMGKQRAMYSYECPFSYDALEQLPWEDGHFEEQEEIYDSLRTKIAMLSRIYRDIIVLYYYDGLSTKAISERLDIPEGTIRWRLTEARRRLRKELPV
mgnify:CR=1 FL=1